MLSAISPESCPSWPGLRSEGERLFVRHPYAFPGTRGREAVMEAVYRREVEQLAESVPQLLQSWAPGERSTNGCTCSSTTLPPSA